MISMLIIELSQSGPYLESFTIYSDTMFDSSQLLLCIYNVLYGNYNVILQYCIILLILYVIESGSAGLTPPNQSIFGFVFSTKSEYLGMLFAGNEPGSEYCS